MKLNQESVIVACSFRLSPEEMLNSLEGLLGDLRCVRGYIVSSTIPREQLLENGWRLVPTDNLDFDFSAYLTGAERVNLHHPEARVIIFVNDTLFTNHAPRANFTALLRHAALIKELEIPAICGKADLYATICLKNPWSELDRYITSYCFMLNRKSLEIMLELRALAEQDGVTHTVSVDSSTWGRGLPKAFHQFVKANLVYDSSSYLWYRLREAKFTTEQISSKARAIYFEHKLSGSVAKAGCMVPTNAGHRWWLYLFVWEWIFRLSRRVGINSHR